MRVTILGAGAYGLALALSFYRNNNQVTVWTKIESEKDEINKTRMNNRVLPGVLIPEDILVTTDLSCVRNSDLIVLAIPINFLRSTCLELKNYVNSSSRILIATKGIENNTNNFCHEILESIIPSNNISVLSGPTFAIDLANNVPSGLTLACKDNNDFSFIKDILESGTLKLEESNDLIGTVVCGSIKNVMAIIAGMLDGLNTTETTKALFYVKATNEIKKLIFELGGSENTVYSLCGIGDLILTCTSTKSRNFTLGNKLITNSWEEVLEYIKHTTVEGYHTLISVYQIMKEKNIDLPLVSLLYEIIFQEKTKEELFTVLVNN